MQVLGENVDSTQVAELVQALIALDVLHRLTVGRIAERHIAVGWPLGHLEKVEHCGIRAAAFLNVAGVNDKAALPHRDNQVALATERLGHGDCAGQ